MTNQTLQTVFQFIVAFGILLTAIGGLGSYYFGQRAQKEKDLAIELREKEISAQKAFSGILDPPKKILLDPSQKIFPKFEFGDSGAIIQYTGEQGLPLFKIAEDNDILVESEDGDTKISTKIRNKEGTIVADIIKNEWKINPNKSWDRNYSKDALEVKDPSGEIILQVRVKEDRIQFQAKLYDSTGRRIGFGKAMGPDGWGGVLEITSPKHPKLELKIQPLFKYPSNLHLGEYVNEVN